MRLFALAVSMSLSLVSCGGDVTPVVQMADGHRFDPETITIEAGATVTFVNGNSEAHTVTAHDDSIPRGGDYFASGGFESEEAARANLARGLMRSGDELTVTFARPGTYRYFCIPHERDGMTGTIVVE